MGGKRGGELGMGGTWELTDGNVYGADGVLGQLRSLREPRVLGRLTKPAALIWGPRRERASRAPSECLTSWESESAARCLPDSEREEEVAGVEGVEGTEEGEDWQ